MTGLDLIDTGGPYPARVYDRLGVPAGADRSPEPGEVYDFAGRRPAPVHVGVARKP